MCRTEVCFVIGLTVLVPSRYGGYCTNYSYMNTECTVVSLTILCVTVTVRNVSDTMREMSRLTMVLPNACRTVESYDQYIRDNITVLRNKIAQARLLASYLQVNCLYSSLYCMRTLTRYSRINYMDKTLQNRCYMCIQWTRVLYYVVITQQSN